MNQRGMPMLSNDDLAVLRAFRQLHEEFRSEWAFTADQAAEVSRMPRGDVISRCVVLLCDAFLMGEATEDIRPRYRLSARGTAYLARRDVAQQGEHLDTLMPTGT
jgi:hypothetical protein